MRVLLLLTVLMTFTACSIDREWMRTGVTAAECAEIKLAMRKVT